MIIGIDGGGTKTEGVLVDAKGWIHQHLLMEGSNPNSRGFDQATATLCNMIDTLKEGQGEIEAICLSIAGIAMEEIQHRIRERITPYLFSNTKIRMGSDALGAMSAGIKNADGIVIIAGTGSAAFARLKGKYYRVGGWGQLIDDAGSGYDIGRLGLRAVLRAYDGRAEETALTNQFIKKMNGKAPWSALGEIYTGGKEYIASFAPLVLNAQGDPIADQIVTRSVFDLAQMVRAARKHLPKGGEIPVVLAGSIWKNDRVRHGVQKELGNSYIITVPRIKPVYGATVEAAIDAGWQVDDAFEENFAQSYQVHNRT